MGREASAKSVLHFRGCAANNLLNQVRNLFASLAERWNFDREYAETVIEVLAECPFTQRVLHLNIGRSKHSYIDFGGLLRSKARKLSILQNMEQLSLHLDTDFTNLIEKQSAAICLFELPRSVIDGPGKSTLSVSEKLTFEQVCRQRRAVDFQELLLETGANFCELTVR